MYEKIRFDTFVSNLIRNKNYISSFGRISAKKFLV
ncbi:hypothetical protein LSS_06834 [Leptospira santarosai serovar Shermani str. LT 821]|nr:hypothetical protein LSS_06834 [Leptospira santarosai serovar Shermani str. LT 821]